MGDGVKHTQCLAQGAVVGIADLITPSDLEEISKRLFKAMEIGVHRSGEATDQDGGVWAFDSKINPLKSNATYAPHEVAIAGFGGTNWQAGVAVIKGTTVELEMRSNRSFGTHERYFASAHEFFDTMVEVILAGFEDTPPSTLALSFGFLHHNHWVETGLDAIVPVDTPAKYWHITGLADCSLSEGLIAAAAKRQWKLSRIYVANDTVGSVLSKPGTTMAMVAGTGVNAAIAIADAKQGNILNLELGRAPILPLTKSLEWLFEHTALPSNQPCLEYAAGGEFHRFHLIALAGMAGESEEVLNAIKHGTSSLVSEIVFDPDKALVMLPPTTLGKDWWLASAEAILTQASVVLASLIESLWRLSPAYKTEPLPIEGSVYWVTPGVASQIETLLAQRGSALVAHKAPGMEGLVRLALSHD